MSALSLVAAQTEHASQSKGADALLLAGQVPGRCQPHAQGRDSSVARFRKATGPVPVLRLEPFDVDHLLAVDLSPIVSALLLPDSFERPPGNARRTIVRVCSTAKRLTTMDAEVVE
jgi:hypothetical protein